MAIYHLSAKIIRKSQGRSTIAAAAYRSGESLHNYNNGITHNYTKKRDVVYKDIILCENAPPEYNDREVLWNEVEKLEKDQNARLAREIEIAIPREISRNDQINLVRSYVKDTYVSNGMCADVAIHEGKNGNPHAHVLLTLRPIDNNGHWESKYEKLYICKNDDGIEREMTAKDLKVNNVEWQKQLPYYYNGNVKSKLVYITNKEAREKEEYKEYKRIKGKNNPKTAKNNKENSTIAIWNSNETLVIWREQWAKMANQALSRAGIKDMIDHRSYKTRGIDKLPTYHLGTAVNQMEKRGISTIKGNNNREIISLNENLRKATLERTYLIQRINQDKSWTNIHESINTLSTSITKNSYDEEQLSKALTNNIDHIEKLINEMMQRKNYHEDDKYLINGHEIFYNEYHNAKANSDLATLRAKIESNLIDLKSSKNTITSIQNTNKPNYDIVSIAQQLLNHRSDYIAAYMLSEDLHAYKENPIYKQQYSRVQEHVTRVKELTKEINNLKEKHSTLGIFHGKNRKIISGQIEDAENKRRQHSIQLKSLGLYDLSHADKYLIDIRLLIDNERDRIRSIYENHYNEVTRMEKAKISFTNISNSIPPIYVNNVKKLLFENINSDKFYTKTKSISYYRAEAKAKIELDAPLKSKGNEIDKSQKDTIKDQILLDD